MIGYTAIFCPASGPKVLSLESIVWTRVAEALSCFLSKHISLPRGKRAGKENMGDPLLTRRNVTPTHDIGQLTAGALCHFLSATAAGDVALSPEGIAFCCTVASKAERQWRAGAGRAAFLPPFVRRGQA